MIKLKKNLFFDTFLQSSKKEVYNKSPEKFWFCKKSKKKIFCENSIITIIHGESILEYEAKKII